MRQLTLKCFTCKKDSEVRMRPWDQTKNITCPICHGKQATIRFHA